MLYSTVKINLKCKKIYFSEIALEHRWSLLPDNALCHECCGKLLCTLVSLNLHCHCLQWYISLLHWSIKGLWLSLPNIAPYSSSLLFACHVCSCRINDVEGLCWQGSCFSKEWAWKRAVENLTVNFWKIHWLYGEYLHFKCHMLSV